MAYLHVNFFSKALSMNTDVGVIIPTPNSDELMNEKDSSYFAPGRKYQALYLLHGTYGDYSDWMRLTSIEKYAQNHKIMVIMPSAANSRYQDMYIGPNYFTYVTEELPAYIRTLFPVSGKREDTFVAGLSMGGYGAFALGIRRPDLYAACASLSGNLNAVPMIKPFVEADDITTPWPWKAILPPPYTLEGSELDIVSVLKKHLEEKTDLPRFFLTFGTEDNGYEKNLAAKKLMEEMGMAFTYEEHPGIHDWDYWDVHIQRALDWMELQNDTVEG